MRVLLFLLVPFLAAPSAPPATIPPCNQKVGDCTYFLRYIKKDDVTLVYIRCDAEHVRLRLEGDQTNTFCQGLARKTATNKPLDG